MRHALSHNPDIFIEFSVFFVNDDITQYVILV